MSEHNNENTNNNSVVQGIGKEKLIEYLEHNEDNHICLEDGYAYQPLNVEGLETIGFDVDAFKRGVESMSELAGKISALANVGISPSEALDYLGAMSINDTQCNLQKTLSESTNDTNIKMAEISGEFAMKQQF